MNCPYCNSEQVKKAGFLASGKQRYVCNNCKKGFSSKTIVKEPIKIKCIHCGNRATKSGVTPEGLQIYKCTVCNKRFNENTLADIKVPCPKCGGKLRYKGWSNNGTVRRYICSNCKTGFSGDINNLVDRTIEKKCPYCGGDHIKRCGKLKSGVTRYYCNDCKKGFNENTQPKETMPHCCPKCGNTELKYCGFQENGKQRYKCVSCGHKFVKEPQVVFYKKHNKKCPRCGHDWAKKAGKTNGKQYYICLSCNHKYLENRQVHHLTLQENELIKSMFQQGITIKEIAEQIGTTERTIRNKFNEYRKIAAIKDIFKGISEQQVCKKHRITLNKIQDMLKDLYKKEKLSDASKGLIYKFGVQLAVPADFIAPYIPCSIHACEKYLSNYTIVEPVKKELTPQEKAFDRLELERLIK